MAITFSLKKGKELIFSKLQVWKESAVEVCVLNKLYEYVCFWFLKIKYRAATRKKNNKQGKSTR